MLANGARLVDRILISTANGERHQHTVKTMRLTDTHSDIKTQGVKQRKRHEQEDVNERGRTSASSEVFYGVDFELWMLALQLFFCAYAIRVCMETHKTYAKSRVSA